MSRYTIYYSTRQIMYKDFAARWAKWAAAEDLTAEQRRGVSVFFKTIAVRFGLVREFRELGVI